MSSMANLRDQFAHLYPPSEGDVAEALRTGLVVPDTNVLLSLYRFQSRARDELFRTFETIGDRLWIPYQVGLEFQWNRLRIIADQEKFFSKAKLDLDSVENQYLSQLRAFSARVAMPRPELDKLEHMLRKAHEVILAQVSSIEQENDVHLGDSDAVLDRLEVLFNDAKVGEPLTPNDLEGALKEARRRAAAQIPPGYMDLDSERPNSSRDFLVWSELLREAGKRHMPTILITDDRKEDWVRREHGRTFGARAELREEMMITAGVPFLLMSTAYFLTQAGKYLQVPVSHETVDQAEGLPSSVEALRVSLLQMAEEHLVNMQVNKANPDVELEQ